MDLLEVEDSHTSQESHSQGIPYDALLSRTLRTYSDLYFKVYIGRFVSCETGGYRCVEEQLMGLSGVILLRPFQQGELLV